MFDPAVNKLKVGDRGVINKTITEQDINKFAHLTGDFSWLHVDGERAKRARFKQRIAHGMLLAGLISSVVGTEMPGQGTIYQNQNLQFIKPCFINDTVKAETEVIELMPAGRVKLKTRCFNQRGEMLVDGDAVVIPPKTLLGKG